ncbi:MAG: hypothetical protein KAR57_06735 [Bacteroidales bacterium]|nr:hypothetical protein [Bacteroidales bacterium]
MKSSYNYRRLVVLILLPALSWLFFNSVYYRHLHETHSGIIISHAHPYSTTEDCSDSPFASHSHTEGEFILYDIISNVILLIVTAAVISLLLLKRSDPEYKLIFQERIDNSYHYLLQEYRGPPSNL